MKQITERQQEVLDFISGFTKENNYPPTVREIGEHFSISLRAVQDHIAALQKKRFPVTDSKTSQVSQCNFRGNPPARGFYQQGSASWNCCSR